MMRSPDPARWLWYAFGGRLPAEYRDWVLRDVTRPNWRLRYALHIVIRTVPFALAAFLILLLLPGVPWGMAAAALGVATVFVLYLTVTSAGEFREVRLVQHGFPRHTADEVERARVDGSSDHLV